MNKKDKKIIDSINKYRMDNLPGLRNDKYKCIISVRVTKDSGIEIIRDIYFNNTTGTCSIQFTTDVKESLRFDNNIAKMLYQWLPVIAKISEINIYPVLK